MGLKGEEMIVKDIVKLVCKHLNLNDLLQITELGGTSTSTEDQQAQINQIISCINDVNHLIAFMYIPLKTTENITISNNKFNFSDLSKNLIELISVKNNNGIKQKYNTFPTFLECSNGNYIITYTYAPALIEELTDTIDVSYKIDDYAFANGVVARYFLYKGLFSDASAWDTKFAQSMLVAQRKKSGVKMPPRRWF